MLAYFSSSSFYIFVVQKNSALCCIRLSCYDIAHIMASKKCLISFIVNSSYSCLSLSLDCQLLLFHHRTADSNQQIPVPLMKTWVGEVGVGVTKISFSLFLLLSGCIISSLIPCLIIEHDAGGCSSSQRLASLHSVSAIGCF